MGRMEVGSHLAPFLLFPGTWSGPLSTPALLRSTLLCLLSWGLGP